MGTIMNTITALYNTEENLYLNFAQTYETIHVQNTLMNAPKNEYKNELNNISNR